LTVVEPTANGIGSDAFALIWSAEEQRLFGLNSSGKAPMLASREQILKDQKDTDGKMPVRGWTPVTVPGAPAAWAAANGRFGRLTLQEALEPAVRYAKEGYPCAPNLAEGWQASFRFYSQTLKEPCFKAWFDTFAPEGRPYEAGDMIFLPDHAATLQEIGQTGAESFYRGDLAKQIDEESRKYGGYLRAEDLAAHRAEWVEPIRVNYRGYEVCEIPPNGQGIAALMALNILKEFEFTEKDSARTAHLQLEAMKLAFADAFRYVTDPRFMDVSCSDLLAPSYGAARARLITDRAQVFTHGVPPKSGTVYFCAADGEGNMVSWIQSNYMGFGSGIVVAGTGIALQNRGADFSLDPAHVNCIAPGKKTYHTIIPGFLMKDGAPVGPFGVMGGYMQPQGHVQVVTNYVDFHMDPQQALDAPRWQWMRDDSVTVEASFDASVARALRRCGHRIRTELSASSFGRGQMIVRLQNGVLVGGTESRTDSNIACF
ncbi:MAG: gamma-glutamyltransferase family protein, partial [Lachnospiraceae bacterium]|nr:gamma-glutamyltransferase family protein [Lachnospiraceae bacterium]